MASLDSSMAASTSSSPVALWHRDTARRYDSGWMRVLSSPRSSALARCASPAAVTRRQPPQFLNTQRPTTSPMSLYMKLRLSTFEPLRATACSSACALRGPRPGTNCSTSRRHATLAAALMDTPTCATAVVMSSSTTRSRSSSPTLSCRSLSASDSTSLRWPHSCASTGSGSSCRRPSAMARRTCGGCSGNSSSAALQRSHSAASRSSAARTSTL
mmetsp:Transcript_36771/g.92879  ORF Transcript_36771/g.92879 Transcript_36771/m.92879 type:complete len:215 (+) Transcript_36771:1618-2262(+)